MWGREGDEEEVKEDGGIKAEEGETKRREVLSSPPRNMMDDPGVFPSLSF